MSAHSLSRPGVSAPVFARRLLVTLSIGVGWVCSSAVAQTMVPGKLPGEFAVSPSGAATYRIPIEVPPGVAGMEPKLALSYNSQAGNGIMGMGWSLEGLSAITRCAKTMATDGVRGSVKHDVDDRFCLDGQRLINVAGAYGAAGSEYRTELESFSRVTANEVAGGTAANGPASFTVRTKAGLTMEYGATADSRIEAQGESVVRVWALNRMRDAKGNVIDYSYNGDNATGQYLLDAVSYAGRSVKFVYEDRPDKTSAFQAGSRLSQVSRLASVRSSLGATLASELRVSYGAQSSAYGSMPEFIQRCVAGNFCQEATALTYRSSGTGQQPTLSMNVPAPFQKVIHFAHNQFEPKVSFVGGDFNGDGWEDLITFTLPNDMYSPYCDEGGCAPVSAEARYRLNRSTGDGAFVSQQEYLGFTAAQVNYRYLKVVAGDVNGDQISDLIAYEIDSNTGIRTMLATGNASGVFTHHAYQLHTTTPHGGWQAVVSDVNGDGRSDLVLYRLGSAGLSTRVLLSNGTGGFSLQAQTNHLSVNMQNWQLVPADLDRDGLTDLLIHQIGPSGIRTRALMGQGNGQFSLQTERLVDGGAYPGWSLSVGDINGDGQPDLQALRLDTASFSVRVFIAKGNGDYEARASQTHSLGQPPAGGAAWKLVAGDVNHDGFGDLIFYTSRYQEILLRPFFFDDTGLYAARNSVGWSGLAGYNYPAEDSAIEIRASNHRADGSNHFLAITQHSELACIDWECNMATQYSSKLHAIRNLDTSRLLSSVSSSNALTQVSYGSTTSSIHTKEAASGYPQISLAYPLQVVSSVAQGNGAGGLNETTYSYGGLKAEHASGQHPGSGRGMLGFRWMKSREVSTGIETHTEYSQSWPTVGQVLKSETHRAGSGNGGLLKQSTASYGCYQSAAAAGTAAPAGATAGCGVWAAGKVYFPFMSSSQEDSWDLNGVLMPRIATANTHGGYADQGGTVRQFGDPTQVQVDIHQGGTLKHRKTTVNEYQPAKTSGADWQLGRLKKATVTSTQY